MCNNCCPYAGLRFWKTGSRKIFAVKEEDIHTLRARGKGKRCHSMQSKSRVVDQGDAQGPAVTLPYVLGVSEAVRRILTPLGVKVSFRPHTMRRHLLMRPKDRTAEGELTGVVYQVPCAGCPATDISTSG